VSQHVREIAVVAICAFIAGFFALWNALLEMEVLDLVNAKLPPEKQYPLLWQNYGISSFEANIRKFSRAAPCCGRLTK
jgi:hypothetical protein